MAAQDYTSVVEQLYVSYFGRPADFYGLQNFSAALDAMKAPKTFAEVQAAVQADKAGTSALSKLVNSFNTSTESTSLYGTDNSQVGIGKFVNAIYQNVLGRDADLAGFNFWVNAITSGALTKANAAAAITQGALDNTTDQGKLDALTVKNKLAVATAFTAALDTPAEITAFSGDAAAANSRSLLSGVNSSTNLTAYQTNINNSIDAIVAAANPGKTFSLTSSVDTFVGTSGNDTFNVEFNSADGPSPLGAFDNIDGGAGKNALNIIDTSATAAFSLPTNATIANIQAMNVSTTTSGAVNVDTTAIAGVTSVKLSSTVANAGDTVNVGAGTAVNVSSAGGAVMVDGGSNVNVNAKGAVTIGGSTAPTGAVVVNETNTAATGANATMGNISVKGGSTVTVTETIVAPTVTGTTGTAYSTTAGNVSVTGTAATTSVTVTQTAAVDAKAGVTAVTGVTAVPAVAQVDKITIGGTIVAGETFTATVGGTAYVYTAQAGDTTANVATGLAALITATGVTPSVSGSVITLTAATAGTPFTATTSTTSVAGTDAIAHTTANVVGVTGVTAVTGVTPVGGIIDGAVSITDLNSANTDGTKANTITTVSLDGYGAASTIKSNALSSLTLANSAKDVTVTDNSATVTNTSLNVSVTNLKSGASLTDNTIKTLNVTTGASTDTSTLAVNATADTKLTVAGAGKLTLNLAGATALKTVDSSATTGSITMNGLGTKVTSVTTGAGADTLVLTTTTAAAVAAVAATSTTPAVAAVDAINLTVSTGAGADSIDVTGVTGTGNFSISAGDGNDTIKVTQAQLVAGNTIDGGAGTDTLVLGNGSAAFAAGDYALINSLVSNVEGIEFKNAVAGVDASKVTFTAMTFDSTAVVTGVSTQTLSTSGTSLTATAAGDVATTFGANGAAGTYAGNLNVTATGATAALTLNADTATVNVKASTTNAVAATIGGDLQTSLTVNLTNAANASSSPTGDNLSTATILVNGTSNTALKSVVLTGAGTVTIDASASGSLTNIDASQLGGTVANGATKGAITGGLNFIGNAAIAETITLGAGHDVLTVASTYGKMDTIVGFDAVKEGTTAASTTDVLTFSGVTLSGAALVGNATSTAGISKMALTSADSTLDLAFVHAATASHTNATANSIVQFQFGGNTYLFADTNGNGTLDSSDFAVKLVGTLDLTGGFAVPPTAA